MLRNILRKLYATYENYGAGRKNRLIRKVKNKTQGMQSLSVYNKYYAYAKSIHQGNIFDLGTGQGGSTISLALGLMDNPNVQRKQVYACDQFFQYRQGPHRFSLSDNPDGCVQKNILTMQGHLRAFGVEDIVTIVPGALKSFPVDAKGDRDIGLIALDTDGYIDRDFGIFFDNVVHQGIMIIDDYAQSVNRNGHNNLAKVQGKSGYEIQSYVNTMKDKLNGGPRILGKHLLTYRLATFFESLGLIEPIEVVRNTLFARKVTEKTFQDLCDHGVLEEIKFGIQKDFVRIAEGKMKISNV